MSIKPQLTQQLKQLTKHQYLEIVTRGNSAIDSALSVITKSLLIPEEGGWLHYQKAKKDFAYVHCQDATINTQDLETQLQTNQFGALLYHQPGGYFANQPIKEIYRLCQQYDCLVIMDIAGSIGTDLCDGDYADVIVGSFGKWKLVPAKTGGFISTNQQTLWKKLTPTLNILDEEEDLQIIAQKLTELPERIDFLQTKVKQVLHDLTEYHPINGENFASVVVVKYTTDDQKQSLIDYCHQNNLPYTNCPRYIRINQPAISIEIKRL